MDKSVIFKAACHVHSNWSYDGQWQLPELVSFFCRFGYRVMLMSEHDRTFDSARWQEYRQACAEASNNRMLIIPGIEYSDARNTVHILVWGVHDFLGNNRPTAETITEATKRGGFCVLAHPSRREAWQVVDPSWLALIQGIELWNRKFDGIVPSVHALDLLKKSNHAIAFAGLDFHTGNQAFPLSMKIRLGGALTQANILQALREKQCRPCAYGLNAKSFSAGLPFRLSYSADLFRRRLSKLIRRR